ARDDQREGHRLKRNRQREQAEERRDERGQEERKDRDQRDEGSEDGGLGEKIIQLGDRAAQIECEGHRLYVVGDQARADDGGHRGDEEQDERARGGHGEEAQPGPLACREEERQKQEDDRGDRREG